MDKNRIVGSIATSHSIEAYCSSTYESKQENQAKTPKKVNTKTNHRAAEFDRLFRESLDRLNRKNAR